MRKLFSILNLILCFELIVSPIAPNLSLVSVARAEGCPTGLYMDSVLNRCLTTAQQANVMNATANCNGDVACYRENAQKAFQEKVNAGGPKSVKDNYVSTVGNIVATAGLVTSIAALMGKGVAKCTSPSFYGMVAGAAALVAGDMMANMGHKKRLKKIKEDWGKVVNPEQAAGDKDKEREASIEAQSQSFEMLARAEDSLASAAKMKRNFYLVATLAYGVSGVVSYMELGTNASLKAAANSASLAAVSSSAAFPPGAAAFTPAAAAIKAATVKAGQTEAASKTGTTEAASDGTATQVTIKAASAAMKAAVGTTSAAVTAAAAATPVSAALVAAGNVALGAQTAAQTATTAWELHTQNVMCIPVGGTAKVDSIDSIDSKSIYAQYTGGKSLDIKQELQFLYNLEHSVDMTSFIMNKKEMDGEIYSPLEQYTSYKSSLSDFESEDPTVFEIFKSTSMVFINNLSPIAPAHAREQENLAGAEESSSGSGPGSSSPENNIVGNVETNAAETYREDKVKGVDLMGVGIGAIAGVSLVLWGGKLRAYMLTPTGRAIFSGVMVGMTMLMAKHAGSQAEASTKRAELLRKMKDEFNQAAGAVNACKSEDRNDPGKPTCYCYTPENQRNNNRGNSAVCQKLWAGISLKPTNYLSGTPSGKICISNSNKADPTCACKQTKTCLKVGINGLSGLNAGTMSMLGQSIAPLNGIANGTIDGANLNSASLENQAANMSKLLKGLENTKALSNFKKNKGKLEAKLRSDLNSAAAGMPVNASLGGNGSIPSNPKEAALMLEKEIDQPLPTGVAGGDQIMAPSNSPAEEALEFGMTADQLAEQEGQIAEVMNQDLDYGGNDINQGSKTNIFDVLSNRYQRSGMRRLFDEKGTTEADKPAVSEITE